MSDNPTSAFEIRRSRKANSNASISVGNITGNVDGNIVIGNNNRIYEYNVHNHYGDIIYQKAAPPSIKRRNMKQQPPRSPRGFVGRTSELNKMKNYIKANEAVLVYGHDGIGKTSLIKQAAHSDTATAMPDGVVTMEGVDEIGQALGLQDIIQRMFDVLFESNPPLKVTSATARTYLSNTRPLIILDQIELPNINLNTIPDLFPKGAVLMASRNPPRDDSFQPLQVLPLGRSESIHLLASKSGISLDNTTRPLIEKICELLGDVPLAISEIANALHQNKIALTAVADSLKTIQPLSQNSIQAAIERCYGFIYSILSQGEREVLATAAAAPGISVERSWLESQAGGETAIKNLESMEILRANSPRLRLLEGFRQVIQNRRGDLTHLQELLLYHLLGQLKTRSLDFEFIAEELGNILGLLQWASNEKRWPDVIVLGRAVDPYLTLQGLWDAWESVLKQVLVAGQNIKDQGAQAWALHQLGTREVGIGSQKQAVNLLVRALRMREAQGDSIGAAYTRHNLNIILPPTSSDSSKQAPRPTTPPIIERTRKWPKWLFPGSLFAIGIAILIFLVSRYSALGLDKKADPQVFNQVGQVIVYRYEIRNNGFTSLEGRLFVSDDRAKVTCPSINTIGNKDDLMNWNETINCTAMYIITQTDLENKAVTNTATACIGRLCSKPKSVTIQLSSKPPDILSLTLEKTAKPATFDKVGQTITYTYIIRNTDQKRSFKGPVIVADEKTQAICPDINTIGNKDGYLDPGESISCSAQYVITPADYDGASVTNTAVATVGGFRSDPKSITVQKEAPALTLNNTANPGSYDRVAQEITYAYTVTNSGNAPLKDIVTVDDNEDQTQIVCQNFDAVGNHDNLLDPNESVACSTIYLIVQTDLDNGSLTNTASARSGEFFSKPASSIIPATQNPGLTLTKTANPTTYNQAGELITYTYVITNSGNVTIESPQFEIADDHINNRVPFNCSSDIKALAPKETASCTATYTITPADIDASSVTNTASIVLPANIQKEIFKEPSSQRLIPANATILFTCPSPPEGWVVYIVRSGDSLYHISTWYSDIGITVADLQKANCIGSSTQIYPGQKLYVPRTPPRAKITGFVFMDPNHNDIQDLGEQAASGITVTLKNSIGTIVATTTTDANGTFTFANLIAGDYLIFQTSITLEPGDSQSKNFAIVPVP